MRTQHRAMVVAAVIGVVAASCSRDPGVPDPEQSEGRLVQVDGLQNDPGAVNLAGNSARMANGSVPAGRAPVEPALADENPMAANGTPAKADQPAGW